MKIGATINERTDLTGAREYEIESEGTIETFPSITTVLSCQPEKQAAMDFWKGYLIKELGSEEAAKQRMEEEKDLGAWRGTAVHTLVENYLLDGREPVGSEQPFIMPSFLTEQEAFEMLMPEDLFRLIKPELDNINFDHDNPHHKCEEVVYSPKLGVAGRLDWVAEYKGKLSVIDIKTSKKLKSKKDRAYWFQQCCFYALANAYLGGPYIENLVIINGRGDGKCSVYESNIFDHIAPLEESINYYWELYNG